MKKYLFVLFVLFSALFLNAQVVRSDLNGIWDVVDSPKAEFQVVGEVPGTVFEALIAEKRIEDPFYGTNESRMGDIYNRDWIYSREFSLTQEMVESDALFLCFEGIDTIAEVFIDEIGVLYVDNMHREWRIDLKGLGLDVGVHRLEVLIQSPALYALAQAKRDGGSLMQPNNKGIDGAPFTRKAWYSFGWDWGARIPDSGIWKDVYILAIDVAEIESTQVLSDIRFNDYVDYSEIVAVSADLTVNVNVDVYDVANLVAVVNLRGFGLDETVEVVFDEGAVNASLSFGVDSPRLWWIYELGSPDLYDLTVTLKADGRVLDSWSQKFGFREIELVRDLDEWGETFYFRLNGVPVFAKGANWIPCDTFIPRGEKAGIVQRRLADAKAANFNFIRIWGGGIYESDEFYDTCDELGILVWQDFAFACYATPDLEDYYENVRVEAQQNVKRLRNRTSLAIWVGNNEIEVAWKKWGYLLLFPRHKAGYDKMFNVLLPSVLAELDTSRTYWPSSPHSGGHSYNPDNPNYGDSHYWMVWHGGLPFSAYRKFPSRFMSEFGFESFPDMKTIAEFAPKEAYSFGSDIMENHQKNGAGNAKIMRYMRQRFSIPKTFEKQVTISQLTQAEAMEYGIDYWRKQRHDFRSMGALYWQFNDTWPVASWSSVDYYGRWKALHYFAKRFFAPVYCSVMESNRNAEMWIVNDLREDLNLTLKWSVQNGEGKVLHSDEMGVMAPAADSVLAKDLNIRPFRRGLSTRNLVLFWELVREDGKVASRGFELFNKPKFFKARKAVYSPSVEQVSSTEFVVSLTSSENALYTHFNTPYDFTASDNFFHLIKGEPYEVTLNTWEPISLEDFNAGLKVESYYELIN